jgi:hypothetical protein
VHPHRKHSQSNEVDDTYEIIFTGYLSRAVTAAPLGGCVEAPATNPKRAPHVAPAIPRRASARVPRDQPHIGDRLVRGATGTRRDPRHAVAGAAGDAVDAGGLEGLGEGHGRQDSGEPAGQHRLARSGWTQEQEIMNTTPALRSASSWAPGMPVAIPHDQLLERGQGERLGS